MLNRWLADLIVLLHAAFVSFVVVGGLLVLKWPRLAWAHVPSVLWGVLIEFGGWICPLTPLENELRRRAGEEGYPGGFVEHYVLHALYPAGLTRTIQWVLGTFVALLNLCVYSYLLRRRRTAEALR